MNKGNHILLFLLHALFLAAAVRLSAGDTVLTRNGIPVSYSIFEPEREIRIPADYRRKTGEFRGLWIATAWNLDFSASGSPADFRKQFDALVRKAADAGFTALIFQVRPMNDAFYPSKFNPFSRYLAGREGTAWEEDFDPLDYMIRSARKEGLEFHAWINPYRVAMDVQGPVSDWLKTLSPENFARKKPDLVLAVPTASGGHMLLLDPGKPEVLLFLISTIREILEKYEVDAIHMDDYFYPYEDVGEADAETFRKYAKKKDLSVEDWRRANIDRMIQSVSSLIREYGKKKGRKIRFGVSPFGIWANLTPPKPASPEAVRYWLKQQSSPLGSPTKGNQSLFRQFADSRKWVRKKWIDYIIPQVYWGFSCPEAPFAAVVDWWADTVAGTGVDLYIGIGLSRMGVSPDCTEESELPEQILYASGVDAVKGVSFYSYRNLRDPNSVLKKGLNKVIETFWRKKP